MAFSKPDPKYDPNKDEPQKLTDQQHMDFFSGLVRFMKITNPEYQKLARRALIGFRGDGTSVKARPTPRMLERLPKGTKYDPDKHREM